jgi:hypothetical protein
MRIIYGEEGCEYTWQEPFPKETTCKCGSMARITFVCAEDDERPHLCEMYRPDDKYWLHDVCCVAVYFCSECLEPTALYNQA